jgi:hypothetical protein
MNRTIVLKMSTRKSATVRLVVSGVVSLGFLVITGCSRNPVEGPDKVFVGESVGALEGAGAGAITGAQVSAGAGPGALVGMGVGALVGAIHGAVSDDNEETNRRTAREIEEEKSRQNAQRILADHYARRLELYPSRDIFPADLFFRGDSAKMCPSGVSVVKELVRMNQFRLPNSRLVVAAYAKSTAKDSPYATHLTERRSREFVNQMVRAGMQPRRLETRSVVVDAPIVLDPKDHPTRYNQAIEIIAIDR